MRSPRWPAAAGWVARLSARRRVKCRLRLLRPALTNTREACGFAPGPSNGNYAALKYGGYAGALMLDGTFPRTGSGWDGTGPWTNLVTMPQPLRTAGPPHALPFKMTD